MRAHITIKTKSEPLDFVTEADSSVSDFLLSRLHERFPNDTFISEERAVSHWDDTKDLWFIDPIDGTENYVANDGQYSVMVGLVRNNIPIFGWIGSPFTDTVFFGGAGYGAWKQTGDHDREQMNCPSAHDGNRPIRLMLGTRCRSQHTWVEGLSGVEFIHSGSVGLRVARILDDEADAYVHLSGKLKLWDTAAPLALARGAELEIGTLCDYEMSYKPEQLVHPSPLVISRPGCLQWSTAFIRPQLVKA